MYLHGFMRKKMTIPRIWETPEKLWLFLWPNLLLYDCTTHSNTLLS